ncbi:TetR/AcrR family transcriptional regulator [Agrococcus carbonis]|uniref:Regulatory protein, tetR family n=1 Tax=Agrococcus carbonis TaxID=684552 RepID=A0A1H1LT42_9MICO|nr:TetR-like C-terminal domain-containing protein [Agrococcus carbonis]SDR77711.1 regulatory protein, tetR family [Agrococcus carbonis]
MPRAGLSPAAVVDLALAELDATGGAPLSLGAVAARAGVKPPSLYKHVAGLPELEALVAARVYDELGDAVEAAIEGRQGADAVVAFLRAYRSFAVRHPARYRWLPVRAGEHPALTRAADRVLTIAARAVAGDAGVQGEPVELGELDDAAIHELRGLRAVAHGFATLEAAGGFGLPTDVDASFERLVARMIRRA